jgi:hypothetical protein
MITHGALRSLPCLPWALQSISAAENLTWSFCQPRIEFAGVGFRDPEAGHIVAGLPFTGTLGGKRIRSGCKQFEHGSVVVRFTGRYASASYSSRAGSNAENRHKDHLRLRPTRSDSLRQDPVQRPLPEARNPGVDSTSEPQAEGGRRQRLSTTLIPSGRERWDQFAKTLVVPTAALAHNRQNAYTCWECETQDLRFLAV